MKATDNAEKFDQRGYFTGTNREMPPSFEEIRALFMLTYAEPAGTPEVDFIPGLNKALFLMNDRLIQDWLKPQKGNLIERLSKIGNAQIHCRGNVPIYAGAVAGGGRDSDDC